MKSRTESNVCILLKKDGIMFFVPEMFLVVLPWKTYFNRVTVKMQTTTVLEPKILSALYIERLHCAKLPPNQQNELNIKTRSLQGPLTMLMT